MAHHGDVVVDRDAIGPRRVVYAVTSLALVVILGLGLVEAFTGLPVYGVNDGRVRSTAGPYELTVRYPEVARPGLAAPFEVTLRRAGGFDGPITLAIDTTFFELWDENGIHPGPAAEMPDRNRVLWEFDAPTTGTFSFRWDGRIEPAVQSGVTAGVWVVEDDVDLVHAEFHTSIRP